MTKVFIGGSRRVTKLNLDIERRIDNMINNGFTILIGDANGIDKAVQTYLSDKGYQKVVVFYSGDNVRNNLGNWATKRVETIRNKKDFAFYALKDLEMAKETDYGFMIWNGKSKGTLNNMINLLRHNKKVLVYYTPKHGFYTLKTYGDLEILLTKTDQKSLEIFEKTLHISEILEKEQKVLPID